MKNEKNVTENVPSGVGYCDLLSIDEGDQFTTDKLLAIREDGLTFKFCLENSWSQKDFVLEFDRLYKTSLIMKVSPIERMIDEATGKLNNDFKEFMKFVWNHVFLTLPPLKHSAT
jgi:hypothetical protein